MILEKLIDSYTRKTYFTIINNHNESFITGQYIGILSISYYNKGIIIGKMRFLTERRFSYYL